MTLYVDQTAKFIDADTKTYPLSFAQIRAANPLVLMGTKTTVEMLNGLGYHVVQPVEQPAGDVVTEGAPVYTTEGYKQTWNVRAFTEEEKAQQLESKKSATLSFLSRKASEVRERGVAYNFASGTQHVQLREADISNLTGLAVMAEKDPTRTYYFRSLENQVNPLTAAETAEMTVFAYGAFENFLAAYWTLQETVKAVTSLEQVPDQEELELQLWAAVGGA